MTYSVAACDGDLTIAEGALNCSGKWDALTPADLYAVADTLSPDPAVTAEFLGAGVATGVVLYGTVFSIRAILRLIMTR